MPLSRERERRKRLAGLIAGAGYLPSAERVAEMERIEREDPAFTGRAEGMDLRDGVPVPKAGR